MKLSIILIVLFLAFAIPTIAYADEPQRWEYAAVQCSGLSLAEVESGFVRFDAWYGKEHNLTTDAAWQTSYESRVNLFAHWVGCGDMLKDGQLSFGAKIYAPMFQFILTGAPIPE